MSQEERFSELKSDGSTTEGSKQKKREFSKMKDTSPSTIARRLGNSYLNQLKVAHSAQIIPPLNTAKLKDMKKDQSELNHSENSISNH